MYDAPTRAAECSGKQWSAIGTSKLAMKNGHRLTFLVVDQEPPQSLSTRKLLLESKRHNVLTAYSPEEGVQMFRRFLMVDGVAIDAGFGEAACRPFVRNIKALDPKMRVVICTPQLGANYEWADGVADSHDPENLLRLLEKMGPRTNIT